MDSACGTNENKNDNNPKDIARESIKDAGEYVERLSKALIEAASLYRTGKIVEANNIYGQCVDGFNWFLSLIVSIEQLFQIDYEKSFNSDWDKCNYKVAFPSLFMEIINCQKKEDWTYMADILEYEINPLLNRWSTAVSNVKI